MAATLVAARAGATTGEWAGTLREVFGEFRAPTGVSGAVAVSSRARPAAELAAVRERVRADRRGARRAAAAAGRQAGPRRALQRRRAGRRTRPRRRLRGHLPGHPADARADRGGGGRRGRALRRPLDPVRLAHGAGARACSTGSRRPDSSDVPVIVGGIIPDSDGRKLRELGVAAVYTPKDFGLTEIMGGIVDVIRKANGLEPDRGCQPPDSARLRPRSPPWRSAHVTTRRPGSRRHAAAGRTSPHPAQRRARRASAPAPGRTAGRSPWALTSSPSSRASPR